MEKVDHIWIEIKKDTTKASIYIRYEGERVKLYTLDVGIPLNPGDSLTLNFGNSLYIDLEEFIKIQT